MSLVQILENGKAALIARGWTQRGSYVCETGEVCALGALIEGNGHQAPRDGKPLPFYGEEIFNASTLLRESVLEVTDASFETVFEYNDASSTTLVDILGIYDRAIEKASA